jgi:signal transduction histidine kinase
VASGEVVPRALIALFERLPMSAALVAAADEGPVQDVEVLYANDRFVEHGRSQFTPLVGSRLREEPQGWGETLLPPILEAHRTGRTQVIDGIPFGPGDQLFQVLVSPLTNRLSVVLMREATKEITIERELEAERRMLQRSNERLDRVAKAIAHDLKAPVRRIRWLLESTAENPSVVADEVVASAIREAMDALEGLWAMIEGTVALARVGAAIHARPTLLASVADDAAAIFGTVDRPDASIEIDLTDETVVADRNLLRTAFTNLYDNARSHRGRKEPVAIVVRAERAGDRTVIEVSDDGPGIAAESFEAALRPFGRGIDAIREERPGVGLGLSLVEEIVDAHGGDLELGQSPTGGLRVRFDLEAAAPVTS